MEAREVMVGICGGVGPAAGLLLHQIIVENTDANGADQGHLSVCHFSRSHDMTDRTEYLLYAADPLRGKPGQDTIENPALGMARTFEMMRAAAAQGKAKLVAGVPCNTFHAKPIWDEFLRRTRHESVDKADSIVFVHMLDETVRFIQHYAPTCTRIGLLSTTGTRESRVYHDLMEPLGFTLIEIPHALQNELHESIYNTAWGIKSTAPAVMPRCVANFYRYARLLQASGAEVIVMGCTEIPFAFTGKKTAAGLLLIDPMVALARALIREADPSRLKRLDGDVDTPWPRQTQASKLVPSPCASNETRTRTLHCRQPK
jgi:aspartate racemase